MNREEFLIKASAYIGVSVGMRDGEMCIDGPHMIVEVNVAGDQVYMMTPDRDHFEEIKEGDFKVCFAVLVTLADQARIDFDKSVFALRAEIEKHVAVINPGLNVNVMESVYHCQPRATFFLGDSGIILYSFDMFGEYPDYSTYEHGNRDGFRIDTKSIGQRRWPAGERGSIQIDEHNYLMCDEIQTLLGSNIRYDVIEFTTTVQTSIPLPDTEVYRKMLEPMHHKFLDFETL